MFKQLITHFAILGTAATAFARDIPVPTGPNTRPIAGNCALGDGQGDLGQISKAGRYNLYCEQLTDAEICLALMKQTIDYNGEQQSNVNRTRAEFCVDEFRKNLLGE